MSRVLRDPIGQKEADRRMMNTQVNIAVFPVLAVAAKFTILIASPQPE
jgi:hypothetical protein